MDDKKKIFVIPEAEIVGFANDDIVTISGAEETAGWSDGEREEGWA